MSAVCTTHATKVQGCWGTLGTFHRLTGISWRGCTKSILTCHSQKQSKTEIIYQIRMGKNLTSAQLALVPKISVQYYTMFLSWKHVVNPTLDIFTVCSPHHFKVMLPAVYQLWLRRRRERLDDFSTFPCSLKVWMCLKHNIKVTGRIELNLWVTLSSVKDSPRIHKWLPFCFLTQLTRPDMLQLDPPLLQYSDWRGHQL